MKREYIGVGLLLGGTVEFVIIPTVAGACHTLPGCMANAYGVGLLHAIAIGFGLGGLLVNLPAMTKWWTEVR